MLMDKVQWIKNTGGDSDRRRSVALRRLDDAIGVANRTEAPASLSMTEAADEQAVRTHEMASALCALALSQVHDALEAWMREQNLKHTHGWKDSIRNKEGAVEVLVAQLKEARSRFSQEESAAMQSLKAARDASIPALFKGARCISRSESRDFLVDAVSGVSVGASGADLVKNIRSVVHRKDATGAGTATPAAPPTGVGLPLEIDRSIKNLIHSAFAGTLGEVRWEIDEKFFQDVLEHALAGIKEELASAVPYLGVVGAAAVLTYATTQAVSARSHIKAVERLKLRTVPSDSKSALEAIHKWQLEDMQLLKARVARASVNLGSQIVGIASAGTLTVVQGSVGICNAILALTDVVIALGRQYQASRALTRYLNDQDGHNPLGRAIFCASPLAGAYYLLNTPTSHIALQLVDLGAPGWQEDVERLVLREDLAKARAEAARLIDVSRYRIVPHKGGRYVETVDKSFLGKVREAL